MARLVPSDRGAREVAVRTPGGSSLYRADSSGRYVVDNPRHAAQMKAEGFFEASLTPVSRGDRDRGFKCVQCGFEGWFRTCGRCGHLAGEQ
jgi:hypothetical protein